MALGGFRREPVGVMGGMLWPVGQEPGWLSLCPRLLEVYRKQVVDTAFIDLFYFLFLFVQQPKGTLQAHDTSSLPTVIMRSKRK